MLLTELRQLWNQGAWLPRLALLVAAAAAAAHVASLAGVGWQDLQALGIGLHIAVMGLLFAALLGRGRDLAARSAGGTPAPLPRWTTGLCVALAAYGLSWFLGLFAAYGEGWYDARDGKYVWVGRGGAVVREMTTADVRWADARMLSVFSAWWLAGALALAVVHHRRAVRRQQAVGTPSPAA